MRAKEVEPVGENGTNQHSESVEKVGFDKSTNVKPSTGTHQGGNAAAYRIAKLKRDFPEIAQALESGEYPPSKTRKIFRVFSRPKCL